MAVEFVRGNERFENDSGCGKIRDPEKRESNGKRRPLIFSRRIWLNSYGDKKVVGDHREELFNRQASGGFGGVCARYPQAGGS